MSQDPPTPPQGQNADEAASTPEKGLKGRLSEASLPSKIALGIGAFGAIFFIGLLISLFIGLVLGESAAVADTVAVIRDLFIILLAMQGLLISLALVILVLQVAALLNLFQNEIKPILQDLQETAQTVKGTSAFVKENVSAPLIETQAWMAGVSTFITRLNPFKADRAEAKQAEPEEKAAPETESKNESKQAEPKPKTEPVPQGSAKPEAQSMPHAGAKAEPKAETVSQESAKPEAESMPSAALKSDAENQAEGQDPALEEANEEANEEDKSRKVDDESESTT